MTDHECPACPVMLRDLIDARQQLGLARAEIRALRTPLSPLELMQIASAVPLPEPTL